VIDVLPLGLGEEAAWDGFLEGRKGALLYQSIGYRDLLVEQLGCESEYLVAWEGGEIRGILPIMWAGSGTDRVCNSLPYYGSHGGPVAASPEAEAALVWAWSERATDPGTLAATLIGNPFIDCEPSEPEHNMTDERISQVTPLPDRATEEDILSLVSREAGDNVRKARRRGVSIQLDPGAIDEVHRVHRENMRAIGGPAKSESLFRAIPSHLDHDIWVARIAEVVVAALLVLRANGTAEYFASATYLPYRRHSPHAALLLAGMAHAAQMGCRAWNWGGTWIGSQDGVYRFKKKWGAREGRYRYFVQVNDPGLLGATPEELLNRFPHFYVAPFAALGSRAVPA